MAAIKTLCIVLLLVLPLFASACQVSVSSRLTRGRSSKYSTYSATIRNVGDDTAANVVLVSSNDLNSISGITALCDANGDAIDNTYQLPKSVQKKGGIKAGSSYTFSFTVNKGESAAFTATCSDDGESNQPSKATQKPTTAATAAATKKPVATSRPSATSKPTTASKPVATNAPTNKAATSKPAATTKPATNAPAATSKAATNAPAATTKPATSGSSTGTSTNPSTTFQKCPTGTWWQPEPMTTWQWQITGTVDTSINVQMYDIDLFAATTTLINTLHSQGRFVICYFSTQYEDWRSDASQFPASAIGNNLDDWAGEKYVNSNDPTIRSIMAARLAMAAAKGCDGVEPDNVDSYAANNGFKLTAADGLDYNKFMASTAHANGLSVGLKNDLDQVKSLVNYFDWALNEQCAQYSECDMLAPFVAANKAVFGAEYSGSSTSVCPKMNTQKISTLFKTLDLNAKINAQCCTSATGGCASKPYTCGNASSKRQLYFEEEVMEDMSAEVPAYNVEELVQEVPAAANSAATAAVSAVVLVAAVFAALL